MSVVHKNDFSWVQHNIYRHHHELEEVYNREKAFWFVHVMTDTITERE